MLHTGLLAADARMLHTGLLAADARMLHTGLLAADARMLHTGLLAADARMLHTGLLAAEARMLHTGLLAADARMLHTGLLAADARMLHTGLLAAANHSSVFLSRRLFRQHFPFNISAPVATSPSHFVITPSVISYNTFLLLPSFHALTKREPRLTTSSYESFFSRG